MGRDTSHDDDTAVLALRGTYLADGSGPGLGLPRGGRPARGQPDRAAGQPARARRRPSRGLRQAGRRAWQTWWTPPPCSSARSSRTRCGTAAAPRSSSSRSTPRASSIGVRDTSPQPPPGGGRRGPARSGSSGRAGRERPGLLLVDMLADSWGWRPESGGKLVWFRLERAADTGLTQARSEHATQAPPRPGGACGHRPGGAAFSGRGRLAGATGGHVVTRGGGGRR